MFIACALRKSVKALEERNAGENGLHSAPLELKTIAASEL